MSCLSSRACLTASVKIILRTLLHKAHLDRAVCRAREEHLAVEHGEAKDCTPVAREAVLERARSWVKRFQPSRAGPGHAG